MSKNIIKVFSDNYNNFINILVNEFEFSEKIIILEKTIENQLNFLQEINNIFNNYHYHHSIYNKDNIINNKKLKGLIKKIIKHFDYYENKENYNGIISYYKHNYNIEEYINSYESQKIFELLKLLFKDIYEIITNNNNKLINKYNINFDKEYLKNIKKIEIFYYSIFIILIVIFKINITINIENILYNFNNILNETGFIEKNNSNKCKIKDKIIEYKYTNLIYKIKVNSLIFNNLLDNYIINENINTDFQKIKDNNIEICEYIIIRVNEKDKNFNIEFE